MLPSLVQTAFSTSADSTHVCSEVICDRGCHSVQAEQQIFRPKSHKGAAFHYTNRKLVNLSRRSRASACLLLCPLSACAPRLRLCSIWAGRESESGPASVELCCGDDLCAPRRSASRSRAQRPSCVAVRDPGGQKKGLLSDLCGTARAPRLVCAANPTDPKIGHTSCR